MNTNQKTKEKKKEWGINTDINNFLTKIGEKKTKKQLEEVDTIIKLFEDEQNKKSENLGR